MLTRAALLYDGDCDFCLTWVRRFRRWDRRGAVAFIPSRERARHPELPRIPDAALDRAMHLVLPDGSVYVGGRALRPLLNLLPPVRPVSWLLRLPGAEWVADRAYRWVAARRHRMGCGSGCRWPGRR